MEGRHPAPEAPAPRSGAPAEVSARREPAFRVFKAFLKLGLTSFGGPIAHLGYFREEFVVRRKWLDDRVYADLVALCQFAPGPAEVGLTRSPTGTEGPFGQWRKSGDLIN